ncbi:hypothetical protein AAFN86_16540 [Roseomonas sp. CAU 1739]|uniref:hypothetical protein n=1 Tax=Roseomonas sp. CAU 1739 TaxID=3140364 RepID=UPI00325B1C99
MVDPDATVRLERPGQAAPAPPPPAAPAGRRPPVALVAAAGLLLLIAGVGAGAWFWLESGPSEPPAKPDTVAIAPPPAPIVRPVPGVPPTLPGPILASEDAIRGHRATEPTLFRLAENPRVFVADFPGLDLQASALNRVAALVEKAGAPRDRVLTDAELATAITRSGETPATYYYGHNYRGRDLERFFALAARDRVALTAEEEWLRRQVLHIRSLVPAEAEFAFVSVPGIEGRVDESMRQAILHHELGHGHFFTNPAFAAHVARVWREVFTEGERARFRAFLAREGYDPALEEVMMNEAMAYLVFTPDPRFFSPAHAGLEDARAEVLRAALRAGAPL